MNLTFKSDKTYRDRYQIADSYSHPAKMSLQLQRWLIERYSKVGQTILDPMAGSGTLLIACTMGRNVILNELEDKFVKMIQANWQKVQSIGAEMGYSLGTATIIQGDARNLSNVLADSIISSPLYGDCGHNYKHGLKVLGKNFKGRKAWENKGVDCVISSPPYEGIESRDRSKESWFNEEREKKFSGGSVKISKGYQVDSIITSPPYEASVSDNKESPLAGGNEKRYGRWKKGTAKKISYTQDEPYKVDSIITSPPYEEALGQKHHSPRADKLAKEKANPVTYTDKVDSIITSPPYELTAKERTGEICARDNSVKQLMYSDSKQNIGNLKSQSYLEAMLTVYQECYRVLNNGWLILVTKNFIRNKQIVRLDLDTIKLCETAGFHLVERHYRKLTQQSFWRILYKNKYPEAPEIDTEDILAFKK